MRIHGVAWENSWQTEFRLDYGKEEWKTISLSTDWLNYGQAIWQPEYLHSINLSRFRPQSSNYSRFHFNWQKMSWDSLMWNLIPQILQILVSTNGTNVHNKSHRHHNKKAISIQPTKLESCERNGKRFKDSSKLLKFIFSAKLWQTAKIQFGRDKKCITQIIYFMIVCQSYCSRFVLFAVLVVFRFVGWFERIKYHNRRFIELSGRVLEAFPRQNSILKN